MSKTRHVEDPTAPEANPAAQAPGRDASRPTRFGWAAWRQVLGRVYANVGRHHLSVVAAGVAFFGVLAIFPGLAALVGLYGLVADPAAVMESLDEIRPLLPPDAYGLIEGQIQALLDVPQQRLGVTFAIGLLLALWSARAGVSTLVAGLNIVYREVDTRNIVLEFLASLALTMLLLVIACVSLLATVAVPALLQVLDVGALGARLAAIGPILILGFAVVFVIGAIYRYGPHRELARKRWVTGGAVAAAAAWVVASYLLSFYISNFANFNKTYGSLGAIAALMFWFYVSAFVVLLGAELNAEMELQTARDTTTGPPRPMGERGAYVADHVA
jgi:membrane protein